MIEVRAGVDQIDRELLALLARRFGYMDAAARIKSAREAVRDEARKAEVIANANAAAATSGLPANVIAELWEKLVEASIAYELDAFDRRALAPSSADSTPRTVRTSCADQPGFVSKVRSVRRVVAARSGGK